MRIGIDARELCGRPTGVGRYLNGLLSEWSNDEVTRRHEFVLYSHEPPSTRLDARRFATREVPGPGGTWWEQVKLPEAVRQDHLDVLFAPGYTAPISTSIPTVVAIHDVSFAAHPEWFGITEGIRRRWLSRQAAERARAVITISQFSKRELVDHMSVEESKIHVIPPGVNSPAVAPRSSYDPPAVLYVGSIFNRRHLPDLIRAFAPIAQHHTDASLDIVGDNRSFPREDLGQVIGHEGLNGRVRWREWIDDAELAALYGKARAFAFLSEYEGFGLTPLEALAAGIPSVLLDTPVARETCGAAALYVPQGDRVATTRALEQLLFDDSVRTSLLRAAPAVLAQFEWPRAARETLAVIEASR
jgi:glycosyltransferase involved in cell wall biosynthesis